MRFLFNTAMELSDTSIPDVFMCEYMQQLDFNSIKLYLYILYVNKSKKEMTLENIAKMIRLSKDELNKAFSLLEEKNLLIKTEKEYIIKNLKEMEIEKIYVPKLDSSKKPRNVNLDQRKKLFNAINNGFFAGTMPTKWYIDINKYMDEYGFEDDVMLALFTTCQKNNKLVINYVATVAQAWKSANIKTENDLNDYYEKQSAFRKIENSVKRFLRTNNNLTEAEIRMVRQWVETYKYDFTVIEEALSKTTGKNNPLVYANKILKTWYDNGFKNLEDIKKEDAQVKTENKNVNNQMNNKSDKYSNFTKRNYEDLDNLFDNM